MCSLSKYNAEISLTSYCTQNCLFFLNYPRCLYSQCNLSSGIQCLAVCLRPLIAIAWVAQVVKNLSATQADLSSIPWSGRSPGEGNGNPLQYSCLENPMDRGTWRATVHGVRKSRTRLSDQH